MVLPMVECFQHIQEELYLEYLHLLLKGRKDECHQVVQSLLKDDIAIRVLYTELFQKSMYRVGELWEQNRISVAREHLATTITESMLNLTYPYLFQGNYSGKKAVISCIANEYHQLGGKMVADIFEIHGWDTHFLGANIPEQELLRFIDELNPDVVGFSLAVYFNLPRLKSVLDKVRGNFQNLDIVVGGHAFAWGGIKMLNTYSAIEYIESLNRLEKIL